MSFWGLKVLPGKNYSQKVEVPFRVTMAAIGPDAKGTKTALFVTVDEADFVLCSLTPGKVDQHTLDVTFGEGEQITFKATGPNPIHLTGYYLPDEPDFQDGDSEEDDGEDMSDDEEGSVELDGMDEDEIRALIEAARAQRAKGGVNGDADSEDDEDMEDDDEEEEEEVEAKPAKPTKRPLEAASDKESKKAKVEPKAAAKTPATPAKAEKKPEAKAEKKAEKKDEKKADDKKDEKTPKSKTLPSGLVIEDVLPGTGARAKPGKSVSVRYIGRLLSGKVFDSNTNGKPFKFQLGKGEVIKGWDLGVQGMNVGGTRKLTIPANLAYGARGAPPDIAPNSTLVFEVKLIDVGK